MKTIAQLIEENGGKLPLKVCQYDWKDGWVEIYFTTSRAAHGKNNFDGVSGDWDLAKAVWQLYTEPRPKVTRWLWANKSGTCTSSMYAENERHKISEAYTVKLLWSATEFEE